MEILDRMTLSKEQLEEVQRQLSSSLPEMDECLSEKAVSCYEVMAVPVDEKTTILYWIRISKDADKYKLELIKEEVYS